MTIPTSQLAFHKALLRIHTIITRGLEVCHTNCLAFAQDGFPDANTQIGFYRYTYSLLVVMDTHHRAEEEIAFPYFQSRVPSLRIEPLVEQHKQMRPHFNEMRMALASSEDASFSTTSLNHLAYACNNVHILWGMHAPAEENYFAANSESALLLTAAEQQEITRRNAEHSQKNSNPPDWVVPFLLFNLPPDEREAMSQSMPQQLTKVMVPYMWKNGWAPMKPFLLD
jgi:hypothetical protein